MKTLKLKLETFTPTVLTDSRGDVLRLTGHYFAPYCPYVQFVEGPEMGIYAGGNVWRVNENNVKNLVEGFETFLQEALEEAEELLDFKEMSQEKHKETKEEYKNRYYPGSLAYEAIKEMRKDYLKIAKTILR